MTKTKHPPVDAEAQFPLPPRIKLPPESPAKTAQQAARTVAKEEREREVEGKVVVDDAAPHDTTLDKPIVGGDA